MEDKLEQFRTEGFAILEQALPSSLLDELHDAYMPLEQNVRDRDRATAERFIVPEGTDIGGETLTLTSENGVEMEVAIPPQAVAGSVLEVATIKDDGGGGGHRGHILEGNGLMVGNERFHLNVPFVAPFATPLVYENPLVMAFMDMLDQLGDENYGMIRLGEESDDVGYYGCPSSFDMYVERNIQW